MNKCKLAVGAILFLLVIAIHCGGQVPRATDIWSQIELEADSIYAQERESKAHVDDVGKEIALRSGRADLEALVRNSDEHLNRETTSNESAAIKNNSQSISYRILLITAGLRVDTDPLNGPRWHGLAAAAIDSYHDARSHDLLAELALQDGALEWKYATSWGWHGTQVFGVYALGLLRGYEPQDIRPQIEAALQAEAAKARPHVPPNSLPITGADYLRALLESWNYAASLEPAERDRYRDFERRLWRAWALADGWASRKAGVQFESAAGILRKHWKEGDDRSLLRIFENPTSTVEEMRIAEGLAHLLSTDGKKLLEAIAQGTSPQAAAARRALEIAARRHTLQGRRSKSKTIPATRQPSPPKNTNGYQGAS